MKKKQLINRSAKKRNEDVKEDIQHLQGES